MAKKDFFVSYNKKNKDWAKWIAGTLENNGYTVYLQAWDIVPGDDFIAQMNDFLQHSESYIAVLSSTFWQSAYCKKEFQSAFNAHLAGHIKKFLPVRVEDFPVDPLYQTTVYIDLFTFTEDSVATEALLNGIEHTANPRKGGTFPNSIPNKAIQIENLGLSFPGNSSSDVLKVENSEIRNIILLETEDNTKNALFSRLVQSVFHSLGFGDTLPSSHMSKRNFHMVLRHRTEKHYALIEIKSNNEKIDSDDVNRFVGAFDVERSHYEQNGNSVTAYLISKSGFTSTALEQEQERVYAQKKRNERSELILLGPVDIVRELIQGKMLCSPNKAASAIMFTKDESLSLCDETDLVVCEYGWVWVLYYSPQPHQGATHFAFVHADGNQLLNHIAESLIVQAKLTDNRFDSLFYLPATTDATLNKEAAKQAYFRYLKNELGEIQFEGMPTDKEAGSVKVNLESIFIPLSFSEIPSKESNHKKKPSRKKLVSIHDILIQTPRSAILAKPGGGKSTLIRRIALAYAYPERRKEVDDRLPAFDWFPVYIRCRDLGDNATKSILEIIAAIVYRAEIFSHAHAFDSLIEDRLQDGRILLLIDGLDEISIEKHRICFVNQLQTFVATYPTVRLIVTSRETGFRAVAGTLANYCLQYSISGLDEKQIRLLSLKWHQAILGESTQTKLDSEKVCDIILGDSRIVALAENPLLLTTLLFVKRWVGYLPTKKCRLYEEMIKLLLVTWNAVAHDRLDMDEAEPQLAFVAYSMTLQGQQKVTRDKLEHYIIQSRQSLPELLSYTKVSPSKFIDQVEERSSLLIQLGLEENESGQMVPSYEFSHLSFQEYLTAKAIAQAWLPDPENGTILSVLEQYILQDQWVEVVPLAAVLLGRNAKSAIEYLINICEDTSLPKNLKEKMVDMATLYLANCIASEVAMSQELLERAIFEVIHGKIRLEIIYRKHRIHGESSNIFATILKSKYGSNYREFIHKNLFINLNSTYIFQFADAWLQIYLIEYGKLDLNTIAQFLDNKNNRECQITGALVMLQVAFQYPRKPRHEDESMLYNIFLSLLRMLKSDDLLSHFTVAWCIAWSGYENADIIPADIASKIANKLIKLWISTESPDDLKRVISWALYSICSPSLQIQINPDLREAIETNIISCKNDFDQIAALHLAVLTGYWSKETFKKWYNENSQSIDAININNYRFLRKIGFIQDFEKTEGKNKQE